jgi:hypothetical protein
MLSQTTIVHRMVIKMFHKIIVRDIKDTLRETKLRAKQLEKELKQRERENKMANVVDYKQSQSHGFVFENEIRHKVFGLSTHTNDTNTHDISKKNNRFDLTENISIKTTGKNDVCCGDILRFYEYDFQDKNTIILGKYVQTTEHKKITEILEIDYNADLHTILFGTITHDELKAYVSMIKSLSHGRVSKSTRAEILKKKKELEIKHCMYIQISPKIDSNKQRRVQCRIRNIDDLINKHPEFLLSKSVSGVIRDVYIDTIITSFKRTRAVRSRQ